MNDPSGQLLEAARQHELHHAVILQGSDPAALTALAMSIARTLNCLEGSAGGDHCLSCLKIERGNHPDVHRIGVAEDRKQISVEQIRNLVAAATLRPYEGRTKVFVIESAEAMNPNGMNALLKTLEEPTRDTVFVLTTRSADLLLPTLRSRSQTFTIGSSDVDEGTRASLQARRLHGDPILRAIPDVDSLALDILDRLARFADQRDNGALLSIAAELGGQENVSAMFALYATILRDLTAVTPEQSVDPSRFQTILKTIPRRSILRAADLAVRATDKLRVNADARLLFEQSLVELTRP